MKGHAGEKELRQRQDESQEMEDGRRGRATERETMIEHNCTGEGEEWESVPAHATHLEMRTYPVDLSLPHCLAERASCFFRIAGQLADFDRRAVKAEERLAAPREQLDLGSRTPMPGVLRDAASASLKVLFCDKRVKRGLSTLAPKVA